MSSNQRVFAGPGGEGLSAVVAKWKTVRLGLMAPSVSPRGEGLPENGTFKEDTSMEGWGHWLWHHANSDGAGTHLWHSAGQAQ